MPHFPISDYCYSHLNSQKARKITKKIPYMQAYMKKRALLRSFLPISVNFYTLFIVQTDEFVCIRGARN